MVESRTSAGACRPAEKRSNGSFLGIKEQIDQVGTIASGDQILHLVDWAIEKKGVNLRGTFFLEGLYKPRRIGFFGGLTDFFSDHEKPIKSLSLRTCGHYIKVERMKRWNPLLLRKPFLANCFRLSRAGRRRQFRTEFVSRSRDDFFPSTIRVDS